MAKLTFLGAAKTVTGSKHLLEWQTGDGVRGSRRVLVDCGMFQGLKELRLKNWEPFPVSPELIDAVIITHAHIDHIGYLPRFVRDGFDGPIYATAATCDLAEIMLRDSAHIQEEDARHARKFGYSKHKNPQPLYTTEDAEKVLPLMKPVRYNQHFPILDTASIYLRHAGHILGSAFVEVTVDESGQSSRVVFSGDVGRYNQPVLLDPDPPTAADYFLLECTYGGRLHSPGNPKRELGETIRRTVERGGQVVIPAFALGRSQIILTFLSELFDEGEIPRLDVFLDSPMAVATTWETRSHREELDMKALAGVRGERLFKRSEFHYLTTRDQSMKLNDRTDPCVIISASGMATAGRILHHMARLLPDKRNSLIIVGYQAEGTRGRRLVEGEKQIKIHGQMVPVNAEIVNLSEISGHADYSEMMPWLRKMKPPIRTFLVHGEQEGLDATAKRLGDELGWETHIPAYGESVELQPVRKLEPVEVETEAAKPVPLKGHAVAVVLDDNIDDIALASMPGTVVFREPPSAELARRIIRSRLFGEVYHFGFDGSAGARDKHEKALISFRSILSDAGIPVYGVKPE